MKIISQDSEKRLLRDLRSLWQGNPQHRCLQLKFSQTEHYNDEWPELIAKELTAFFEDVFLDVYTCLDHDIFIVNRTITHKRVVKLLTHLKPKLGLAREEIAGLASLFEIGVDWSKLRTVCEKKIEIVKENEEKKEPSKNTDHLRGVKAKDKTRIIKEANKEMIQTLSSRRNARKNTEIMVVEDDPLSQRLIKNILKEQCNCTIIGEGTKAYRTYLIKAPDVLFLDIGLPDISGHDILKNIFEIDPDAYIIMFSGNGDKENVLKAINLGAKGFLGKPFTQDKLLQYIEKSPHIKEKRH